MGKDSIETFIFISWLSCSGMAEKSTEALLNTLYLFLSQ